MHERVELSTGHLKVSLDKIMDLVSDCPAWKLKYGVKRSSIPFNFKCFTVLICSPS